MTFKNKRAEVHWYVIGIVLALVVLLLTLFGPVREIFGAQEQVSDQTKNTCALLADGLCRPTCETGEQRSFVGICPDDGDTAQVCCVES